jgi:hypothetical protein
MHELYHVLGVRSKAADEEIKVAFRRLAKQLHPDLHPGDADAGRRLQDVIRAYETLSDRRSRMAYDAGLENQRSLRRWRFRANAMTMTTAFALTVSIGLHWRALSDALLPAGEHRTRLTGNEGGSTVATKSMEAHAEPSLATAADTKRGEELVTGSLPQHKSPLAPSPQSLVSPDPVTSDGRLVTSSEKKSSSVPVVPSKSESGAVIRNTHIKATSKAHPAGHAHVFFLCGDDGNDMRHLPPHRRLWCSWPALHGSGAAISQASPKGRSQPP